MNNTPLRKLWSGMLARCTNPRNSGYLNYGGRGITVCERWKKFENFYADMGVRPAGMSLDRIDNDKGYSPENCRWATLRQQMQNSRRARFVEYEGESLCIAEWERRLELGRGRLQSRLARGVPVAEAMSRTRLRPSNPG